jgi:hypothetical protein
VEVLALWIDCSSCSSIIVFLSVPFPQMIRVAFSTTIRRAWQEHNIISWKQALAAERPTVVLFFLSFFVCRSRRVPIYFCPPHPNIVGAVSVSWLILFHFSFVLLCLLFCNVPLHFVSFTLPRPITQISHQI